MHPQVIQDHPGDCPICHMKLTPLAIGMQPKGEANGERKIRYWWDPMMNPPYISDEPGKSPMGMDLVPVYADETKTAQEITIDPVVVQNMGVRVAAVTVGPLTRTLRVLGTLMEPEPNHVDINLRVSGWIEKLYANTDGMPIEKGVPLFDLYSPDLQVAIEELIAARKSNVQPAGSTSTMAAQFYDLARQRLAALGLTDKAIDRLAALDRAPHTVAFESPTSGHITEKVVVEGAAVKAGDRVLRIADNSTMWIELRVFESDLPWIRIAQAVSATVAAVPSRVFEGRVTFIHPHLDPLTRTSLVRVVVPNESMLLRENMFATAEIKVDLEPRALRVPRSAVIDTGLRQIAFVMRGAGRFEAVDIKLGPAGDDGLVQVLAGLTPSDTVVTSGQFLLDAESRTREAIEKQFSRRLLAPAGATDH